MSSVKETFKQYLEKNGKTLEDNNIQEEFAKYMGQCLLEKVEVTIGSTTHVTEFENGNRTDYRCWKNRGPNACKVPDR